MTQVLTGWIRIHRDIMAWKWYKKPEMVHLYTHLIMTANRFDSPYRNIVIKRGQLKTNRKTLCEETGISEQTIRTCLDRLISDGLIGVFSTRKYHVITISNFDDYSPPIMDVQPARKKTTR
jgi:hypothetical protein